MAFITLVRQDVVSACTLDLRAVPGGTLSEVRAMLRNLSPLDVQRGESGEVVTSLCLSLELVDTMEIRGESVDDHANGLLQVKERCTHRHFSVYPRFAL